MRIFLVVVTCSVLLAELPAFGQQPAEPKAALNLAEHVAKLPGQWLLTLPKGPKYLAVLRPVEGNRYRLEKAARCNGEYEVRENQLVLIGAANSEDGGFAWEMRAQDELVLVEHPAKETIAYHGATLKRQSAEVPPVATGKAAPPAAPALALADHLAELRGQWLLTLPSGALHEPILRPEDNNRFQLDKAARFGGLYEIRDNQLVLTKGQSPVDAGFAWEMRAPDELVLVGQGPKVDNNYRGATLKRKSTVIPEVAVAKRPPAPAVAKSSPPPAPAEVEAPPPARPSAYFLVSAVIVVLLLLSIALGVWLSTRQRREDAPVTAKSSRASSAALSLVCPACDGTVKARTGQTGKKIKCAHCGQLMVVPQRESTDD